MANSTDQLDVVRGVACTHEQRLAADMAELVGQHANAELTMHRLGDYIREYQVQAEIAGARSLAEIENERNFLKRLNTALEQQRSLARQLASNVSTKTTLWQQAKAKLRALDKVIQQRELVEQRAQQRRDQKENDAHNLRVTNPGVFQ